MTMRDEQAFGTGLPILRTLVECIRDARPPNPEEMDAMSDHLWHQGLALSPIGDRGHARLMAEAAFCGNHLP
jgi:hypothetical protein